MPNFLKSIFKRSSRSYSTHPQGNPAYSPIDYLPTGPPAAAETLRPITGYPEADIQNGEYLGNGSMKRLLDVLEEDLRDDSPLGPVGPLLISSNTQGEGGPWGEALRACEDAIEATLSFIRTGASTCSEILALQALLEDQRSQLLRMRPYAENKQLPSLAALSSVYLKVRNGLLEPTPVPSAMQIVQGMIQMLLEAPSYLINIALIEALIWQAEVIDPSLGSGARKILDRALAKQDNVEGFRNACDEIKTLIARVDVTTLDDELARDAHLAICDLIRQLQDRLFVSAQSLLSPRSGITTPASVSAAPTPPPDSPSINISPRGTPKPSRSPSPTPSPSTAAFEQLDAKALQDRYGTGIAPSPSPYGSGPVFGTASYAPIPSGAVTPAGQPSGTVTPAAPTPESPVSPTESEKSIWEYQGNLLTRSALELILRQEALAAADSSGQYAGEVSWDDIRGAYIPKWAEKLRPAEVAEGEVPDTNPANFEEKKTDAWGNKIGWYEGRMFYKEDPKFDI